MKEIIIEVSDDSDFVLIKALVQRLGLTVRGTAIENAPWWEGMNLDEHLITPSKPS
ncbi:hypothetical protein [Spirosoma sordidisoli]|uniref:hypothetical protein n=1 Tax=Spirosoma sordidisoli TaxID=2502893 RepID=UPI0013EB53F3|nr:hypothetical protein [Spirosoma sordidisoli]